MNQTFLFIALVVFILAILHTFSVKLFQHLAHGHPSGSVMENLYHLLGEVEVVFGIWALILMMVYASMFGYQNAILYIENLNFTEPGFVFVIMVISSTKPVVLFASTLIQKFSNLFPVNKNISFYFFSLVLGPLLGSFITEPAAMTVTALILLRAFYEKKMSDSFKYATLALLFVNVSIGGTLTPYAAPPILMVASTWQWDLAFIFSHFGIEAIISILISTTLITFLFKKELKKMDTPKIDRNMQVPLWIIFIHLLFLFLVVLNAHHLTIFIAVFLFFLGVASVTREYQDELKIKEGLLVGFFLAGLVVLGSFQSWWLTPILTKLDSFFLYLGSIGLTAITDNAALTYLGSQVEGLGLDSKLALVSGAVIGGGLTVIANAPNPAGLGILNKSFGDEGVAPLKLFYYALIPTTISAIIFWVSRSFF